MLDCDVSYTRSWVSRPDDLDDPRELGTQQTELWSEAIRRATTFVSRVGEERFADVFFDELNADAVGTVERPYGRIGLDLSDEARGRMRQWSIANARGSHGSHEFALSDFGLEPDEVRKPLSSTCSVSALTVDPARPAGLPSQPSACSPR